MCGRFYVPEDDDNELIVRIIRQAEERAERLRTGPVARGEVFPDMTVAALAPSRRGGPEAFPMHWGYRLRDGKRSRAVHHRAGKPVSRDLQETQCEKEDGKTPSSFCGRAHHAIRSLQRPWSW